MLEGRYARLERLTAEHASGLWEAFAGHDELWRYMGYGPFADAAAFVAWVDEVAQRPDPYYYAIIDRETGLLGGLASYLRITPEQGVIEVGAITYGPVLQRTRAATETMALMATWVFEAGYRRYEWKCDALNRPSRRAAERLGFSFEGVFRRHMIVKGRSRDTAWFAITAAEWPRLREAWDAWLEPANFDAAGRQRQSLGALTASVRVASDPEGEGGG